MSNKKQRAKKGIEFTTIACNPKLAQRAKVFAAETRRSLQTVTNLALEIGLNQLDKKKTIDF